eukprot:355302-Chlamydomonas_euryale.AAC.9
MACASWSRVTGRVQGHGWGSGSRVGFRVPGGVQGHGWGAGSRMCGCVKGTQVSDMPLKPQCVRSHLRGR